MQTQIKRTELESMIEEINRRNSVGFIGREKQAGQQERPSSQKPAQTFSRNHGYVRVTVINMGSKKVLEAVSKERLFFYKLRRATNGKTPFIIIARTPLDEITLGENLAIRYTIWAKYPKILRDLRDRINDIDRLPRESSRDYRGFNWAVIKGHQDGEFYLKSPYQSGGTTVRPGRLREIIRQIIQDRRREARSRATRF